MKPAVICLMISSLDGRLDAGGSSDAAKAEAKARGAAFESLHDELDGDGWIIGRVTGAEMSKATAHPPATFNAPERSNHFAERNAKGYAIIVDPAGKLHFKGPDIGGEHVVVLLGRDVPDSHLAELAADGVSYVTAEGPEIDLAATLELLGAELGVKRLLLEGGGGVNGAFLKAGLVEEIHLLVWPGINGQTGGRAIFEGGDEGVADFVALTFEGCDVRADGVVHLRYRVTPR